MPEKVPEIFFSNMISLPRFVPFYPKAQKAVEKIPFRY